MIIGIGSDLIDIRRIEKIITRFETRFIERCFTDIERAKAESRRAGGTHINIYAKRFAAKEACTKALGTGFGQRFHMQDIGIINLPSGQPVIKLTGGAKALLEELVPNGMKPVIHLTITDEPPLAKAFVIIEAL